MKERRGGSRWGIRCKFHQQRTHQLTILASLISLCLQTTSIPIFFFPSNKYCYLSILLILKISNMHRETYIVKLESKALLKATQTLLRFAEETCRVFLIKFFMSTKPGAKTMMQKQNQKEFLCKSNGRSLLHNSSQDSKQLKYAQRN